MSILWGISRQGVLQKQTSDNKYNHKGVRLFKLCVSKTTCQKEKNINYMMVNNIFFSHLKMLSCPDSKFYKKDALL